MPWQLPESGSPRSRADDRSFDKTIAFRLASIRIATDCCGAWTIEQVESYLEIPVHCILSTRGVTSHVDLAILRALADRDFLDPGRIGSRRPMIFREAICSTG